MADIGDYRGRFALDRGLGTSLYRAHYRCPLFTLAQLFRGALNLAASASCVVQNQASRSSGLMTVLP